MNQVNNKRRKESQQKIENTFITLLQTKDVKDITVSDICKITKLNRSTFYANYLDIYDLVEKIKIKMVADFFDIYKEETTSKQHSYNFLKLFQHIKNNQIFYRTYFKLGFDIEHFSTESENESMMLFFGSTEYKEYHIAFFKAGINAIIKKWLDNGCQEEPEEIEEILKREYKNRIDK